MAERAINTVPPVTTSGFKQEGRRLTLEGVLADLVADRLVSKEDADRLTADRRWTRCERHSLQRTGDDKKTLAAQQPPVIRAR